MKSTLTVGFNRQAIPSDESIPLTGYSNEPNRYHQTVGQEICITCVAISDCEDATVLMVGMDICTMNPYLYEVGRAQLSEATGVPVERIFMAATHPHFDSGAKNMCCRLIIRVHFAKRWRLWWIAMQRIFRVPAAI